MSVLLNQAFHYKLRIFVIIITDSITPSESVKKLSRLQDFSRKTCCIKRVSRDILNFAIIVSKIRQFYMF